MMLDEEIRLKVLRHLDKEGILRVPHHDEVLKNIGEMTGYGELKTIQKLSEFRDFAQYIRQTTTDIGDVINGNRRKALAYVEETDYDKEVKEELMVLIRKKFEELYAFFDREKELIRILFEGEHKAFIYSNFFTELDNQAKDFHVKEDVRHRLFDAFYDMIKEEEDDDAIKRVVHYLLTFNRINAESKK